MVFPRILNVKPDIGEVGRHVRAERNPVNNRLPFEPRHLSFGKLPSANFDQLDRLGQRAFVLERFHHLPVSESLHRRWIF